LIEIEEYDKKVIPVGLRLFPARGGFLNESAPAAAFWLYFQVIPRI
jgi:hypothetical protein